MTRELVQLNLAIYAVSVNWDYDKLFRYIATTMSRRQYLMLPGKYTVNKLHRFLKLFKVDALLEIEKRHFIIFCSFRKDESVGYLNFCLFDKTEFPSSSEIKENLKLCGYDNFVVTNILEVTEKDIENFKS